MKDKATSFDIAYLAGVSQSTVSRALRDSPQVNKETRDKVHAIARQLNYKVDKNASNLRKQRSSTLALLLFEDPTTDESLINPFFLSMLGSITRACAQRGQDLLVSFQQLSDDWHADYEDTKKADGIILLGYGDYEDYEEKLDKLLAQETHFVCWGAEVEGHPDFSIRSNNRQGGRLAGEHLLQLGHKHFAFIGNASAGSPEFNQRFLGFTDALQDAGIHLKQIPQYNAISTEQAGQLATLNLLDAGHPVDAIFCASDLIAIGVMQGIQLRGLKVPEDIAVVGFDDIPVASYANPPLSTIQQDTTLAGEMLVQNLLQLINNQPIETNQIEPKIVIRKSCGTTPSKG
ncbi:LacI family DNA-binding transcriptional regulator [Alkalimonas collagenimarina]|uniref:LacI family DNA-binding transcriptional regulator n=1 Tax=Alkalimonas collagenimarina TaxID=400390 RepID=A0ABT9GYV3_9GAMM|nr:LacI family DNA-binding transcriptional regulator [Alkalimonas collagenimarina]MDP4536049.1 LacI family DNA-binding transcriptional regulator [Alkalimonas collagenimarina]